MDEIKQKGLMMDQEKVTRVDFMFNAVRNTVMHFQTEIRYILRNLLL